MDLERHVAEQGWDQPLELYALVPTVELLEAEPAAAQMLGITEPESPDDLTPGQQARLPGDVPLEEARGRILWPEGVGGPAAAPERPPDDVPREEALGRIMGPEGVAGCALVMERLVVKGSDETLAVDEDPSTSGKETEEIRMVAGVVRDGSRYCAMRMRNHDTDEDVMHGNDLVPALTSALALTLDIELSAIDPEGSQN